MASNIYIFYDFETTSRSLLGQILSYAFVVTDENLNPVDELSGTIKLNRCQIPEPEAILTNKLNIDELENSGDAEHKAAEIIHKFLDGYVGKGGPIWLCGYNSNAFDLNFLRNLLIKYGWNPYFKGRLKNKDVLHFVDYLQVRHPNDFPKKIITTEKSSYFSLKLEDLSTHFNILSEAQSHDALEDVHLTIKLVRAIQNKFNASFTSFEPVQRLHKTTAQLPIECGKTRGRDFTEPGQTPADYASDIWIKILATKKDFLLLNVKKFVQVEEEFGTQNTIDQPTLLSCLRYVNGNKAYLPLEPLSSEDISAWEPTIQKIAEHSFYRNLTWNFYFELIKKDWDIEHQIHNLGFDAIPVLRQITQQLIDEPDSYFSTLKQLLAQPSSHEQTNLIRLYNRNYLNIHPNPRPDFCMKYLKPRYMSGELEKNKNDFRDIETLKTVTQSLIEADTSTDADKANLQAVLNKIAKLESVYLQPA